MPSRADPPSCVVCSRPISAERREIWPHAITCSRDCAAWFIAQQQEREDSHAV